MNWARKAQGSTSLGNRVKQERLRLKISLHRLAAEVGCSLSQLTGLENRGVIPHVRTLVSIALIFNCSLDWLMGIEDDPGDNILNQIGVTRPGKL